MPDIKDAYFLDCGLTYDDDATAVLTGLDHLEGETVKVIADGKVHPDCTVSGGAIALDYSASVVHVGFGFTSTMKSLPIEAVTQEGPTMGRLKEAPEVILLVNESVGIDVGPDEDNLDTRIFTEGGEYDTSNTLFTGAVDVMIESGHERQPRIVVQQSEALPCTILALNIDYEVTQ